jgi:hypothetical protein
VSGVVVVTVLSFVIVVEGLVVVVVVVGVVSGSGSGSTLSYITVVQSVVPSTS